MQVSGILSKPLCAYRDFTLFLKLDAQALGPPVVASKLNLLACWGGALPNFKGGCNAPCGKFPDQVTRILVRMFQRESWKPPLHEADIVIWCHERQEPNVHRILMSLMSELVDGPVQGHEHEVQGHGQCSYKQANVRTFLCQGWCAN